MRGADVKPAAPVAGPASIRRAGPVTSVLSLLKPKTIGGKISRGLRNNNPGNIRHSPAHWIGQSEVQTDPSFVQFDSMAYGVRALGKLLQTYQDRYHLSTIFQIISRWAPPNENNTQAYALAVADIFRINGKLDVNVTVDMHTHFGLMDMVTGIIEHENGLNVANIQPYMNDIEAGVRLCLA